MVAAVGLRAFFVAVGIRRVVTRIEASVAVETFVVQLLVANRALLEDGAVDVVLPLSSAFALTVTFERCRIDEATVAGAIVLLRALAEAIAERESVAGRALLAGCAGPRKSALVAEGAVVLDVAFAVAVRVEAAGVEAGGMVVAALGGAQRLAVGKSGVAVDASIAAVRSRLRRVGVGVEEGIAGSAVRAAPVSVARARALAGSAIARDVRCVAGAIERFRAALVAARMIFVTGRTHAAVGASEVGWAVDSRSRRSSSCSGTCIYTACSHFQ